MTIFRNWLQREIDTLEEAPSGAVSTDHLCAAKVVVVPTGDIITWATFDPAEVADSGEIVGPAFEATNGANLKVTLEGNYIISVSSSWPANTLGTYRHLAVDDTGSNAFPDYSTIPPFNGGVAPHNHVVHAYHMPALSEISIQLQHDAGVDQNVFVIVNALRVG